MSKISHAIATGLVGSVLIFAPPAEAGLIGAGNTVAAIYFNGSFASPEGLIPVGGSDANPTSLAAPVNYSGDTFLGGNIGITIAITDTQIVLTNMVFGALCFLGNVGNACTDVIDGFDFIFTGENILGVSANIASAADFLPVSGIFQGNTHLGLQLLSPNEILVDLTGDLPLVNDQLILDLRFAATPPPPTMPEPGTLALLGVALIGLVAVRRRSYRGSSASNGVAT